MGKLTQLGSVLSSSPCPGGKAAADVGHVLALKSPNRYVQMAIDQTLGGGGGGGGGNQPKNTQVPNHLFMSCMPFPPPICVHQTSLEGATSSTARSTHGHTKPAHSNEPEAIQAASGTFRRVEMQWKDVDYTVREGKKREIAKKVGVGLTDNVCVCVRVCVWGGGVGGKACARGPTLTLSTDRFRWPWRTMQVLTNQWGMASSGEILAIMGPSGEQ
jgi:hypothetical protein